MHILVLGYLVKKVPSITSQTASRVQDIVKEDTLQDRQPFRLAEILDGHHDKVIRIDRKRCRSHAQVQWCDSRRRIKDNAALPNNLLPAFPAFEDRL